MDLVLVFLLVGSGRMGDVKVPVDIKVSRNLPPGIRPAQRSELVTSSTRDPRRLES